jgi:hypothetical protein
MAVAVNRLQVQTFQHERWPVAWKGGRLVDLWKKKLDAKCCENSRGLLVADHLAKCTIGLLKDECCDRLCDAMPDKQLGGVPGGGTDVANHIIRSLMDFSKCMR